jgi:hypothetical protein
MSYLACFLIWKMGRKICHPTGCFENLQTAWHRFQLVLPLLLQGPSQKPRSCTLTAWEILKLGTWVSSHAFFMTFKVNFYWQVRPFTLGQLKELLGRTGTLVEEAFWIDKIKSHCFVTVRGRGWFHRLWHILPFVTNG